MRKKKEISLTSVTYGIREIKLKANEKFGKVFVLILEKEALEGISKISKCALIFFSILFNISI